MHSPLPAISFAQAEAVGHDFTFSNLRGAYKFRVVTSCARSLQFVVGLAAPDLNIPLSAQEGMH